ncbi:3' exoribonuclease [Nannizzia gypsea CBS 118893]|uniref:Ribosomal RNA-processing protein 43 n=1 Tax=Arthroderma gypseum (strain ATCC MYA-4604 / CBS 118893) TaxID=535722 RepID=E5R0J5_ARTGP|nr:3' exoribonuclease [Nannizzia gypsea CBS 118893]EFQ98339.1 3' exoribonuclease [Nannizzia gypsea CBS 118893]
MATANLAAETSTGLPSPVPAFSISPAHLAQLQPHTYTLAHLQPSPSSSRPSVRINGRTDAQFRPASVSTGSLTHTNGSAVVRMGDTAAVCGVRAEILHTDDIASWKVTSDSTSRSTKRRKTENTGTISEPDLAIDNQDDNSDIQSFNLLVPNLSLSTGCSPSIFASAPPTALAQSLSQQLLSLLHSSNLVCAEDLRIWYTPDPVKTPQNASDDIEMDDGGDNSVQATAKEPEVKAFWTLYIDVLMVSLAGNPFDVAWTAVVAALRNTKLPKAWWDLESERVLCSDRVSEARGLRLRGMPISSSFCVFEAHGMDDWRRVFLPFDQQKGKGKKLGSPTSNDVDETYDKWVLADPDAFEESLCPERVCIVVDLTSPKSLVKIVKLEKNGGFYVGKEEMKEIVNLATSRWNELKMVLEG